MESSSFSSTMEHTAPDFGEVSRSLDSISRQVARVGNLPSVDSGAHVLDALRQLMAEVATLRREQQEARREQGLLRREQQQGFARFESAMEVLSRENAARCVIASG